jgi:hypothetical protein
MGTVEPHARYEHSRRRYPSGQTDKEWALVRPQRPRAKLVVRVGSFGSGKVSMNRTTRPFFF